MEFQSYSNKAETFIVNSKQEHRQTFILLHGRGDRADSFGFGLLTTNLQNGGSLQSLFPRAKFVFLQAPLRELAAGHGMKFYQWFDVYNLHPGSEESDLQIPDLRETVHLVHGTLEQEIALVGPENVILGGLSQGCASSLISLLLWDGPPLAACVGMSGWLPFRSLLQEAASSVTAQDANKPTNAYAAESTQQPAEPSSEYPPVKTLARKLGYAESFVPPTIFQQVPVFLGHGVEDDVVVTSLGLEASSCMKAMHANVTWKTYADLPHWYSPEMLQDIVEFVKAEAKWT